MAAPEDPRRIALWADSFTPPNPRDGNVEVPQSAFMAVLKSRSGDDE